MLASSDKASTDVSANVKRKFDFVGLSVCVAREAWHGLIVPFPSCRSDS